jgi:hypothetical protein
MVLALTLGLALATAASAVNSLVDKGRVVAVDVAGRTVTVDDRVFEVDSRTRIEDLDGRVIPLAKVPTRDAPPYAMNQAEPGSVSYEAVRVARRWRLVRLSLIDGVPQ